MDFGGTAATSHQSVFMCVSLIKIQQYKQKSLFISTEHYRHGNTTCQVRAGFTEGAVGVCSRWAGQTGGVVAVVVAGVAGRARLPLARRRQLHGPGDVLHADLWLHPTVQHLRLWKQRSCRFAEYMKKKQKTPPVFGLRSWMTADYVDSGSDGMQSVH